MSLGYLAHKAALFLGRNWDFSERLIPEHCTPGYPGKLFRRLFGRIMNSERLYKSLHSGSEEWFEKHFVIQDFYLRPETVSTMIDHVLNRYRITPIWICPVKSTLTPQIFSPHFSPQKELLFDVGVYGQPFQARGPEAVQDLEGLVTELKGRKMFYAHTYFTPEQFWNIYPKEPYKKLRQEYSLDALFPEITDKVLK